MVYEVLGFLAVQLKLDYSLETVLVLFLHAITGDIAIQFPILG